MPDHLSIRHVKIDSLHLDPANARTHGTENLEAIVGSLKRFGQAEPLVVQKATGQTFSQVSREREAKATEEPSPATPT